MSSSKSHHHHDRRRNCAPCASSCPSVSHSSRASCSSLSCLKECGKDECMLVSQFLDFLPTGPVYLNRIIPKPCCQEIDGLPGSKNRLDMKFQEMKAPFYVEAVRCAPKGCPDRHHKSKSSCSTFKVSRSTRCSCSLCTTQSSSK